MAISTAKRRQMFTFYFAYAVTVLLLLSLLGIIGFEIYVRWNLNQDFGVLSGFSLPALIISASALILGLTYAYREKK